MNIVIEAFNTTSNISLDLSTILAYQSRQIASTHCCFQFSHPGSEYWCATMEQAQPRALVHRAPVSHFSLTHRSCRRHGRRRQEPVSSGRARFGRGW